MVYSPLAVLMLPSKFQIHNVIIERSEPRFVDRSYASTLVFDFIFHDITTDSVWEGYYATVRYYGHLSIEKSSEEMSEGVRWILQRQELIKEL